MQFASETADPSAKESVYSKKVPGTFLKGISLKNFRNIRDLSLRLHPQRNIFVGANAQGKTNILESIYLLAFGRSFRLLNYKDLIRLEQMEAVVRAWVLTRLGEEERGIRLSVDKKRFLKNGKPVSPNQFESFPVVLFAPEEILLLKDSPQARRHYMDGLFAELSPTYYKNLRQYKRVLAQRNKLLKEETLPLEEKRKQIVNWETPLIEYGKTMISERKGWGERLNGVLGERHKTLSGSHQNAVFHYKPNVGGEQFQEEQERRREEELQRETSLVGPHRDDWIAVLDQKPLHHFGSQGEMRTFILALKLSEIMLIEERFGKEPILLLDDVVSELDEQRNRFLFSFLKKYQGQVFATVTSLNLVPAPFLQNYQAFEVKEGCV